MTVVPGRGSAEGPGSTKLKIRRKHACKDARCERGSAESLTAVQFDSDPSQWLHYWYSCGMIITRTFFLKPEACLPNTSVKEEEGGGECYAREEADKERDGKERRTEFNKVQQGRKDCTSTE